MAYVLTERACFCHRLAVHARRDGGDVMQPRAWVTGGFCSFGGFGIGVFLLRTAKAGGGKKHAPPSELSKLQKPPCWSDCPQALIGKVGDYTSALAYMLGVHSF